MGEQQVQQHESESDQDCNRNEIDFQDGWGVCVGVT